MASKAPAKADFQKEKADIEAVALIPILGFRRGESGMFPKSVVEAGWAEPVKALPANQGGGTQGGAES